MATLLTVLHTSDWQCGRPFLPRAADALVALAEDVAPDVIVAAGDLTQRAKAREFRQALALRGRLPPVPFVATPGNHDVPLYRAWERIFAPYAKWSRFMGPDLVTSTRVRGATFVTVASSAPRRAIVNGRLLADRWERACRAWDEAPPSDLRCLVVHHHFVPTPDGEGGHVLPAAAAWLERIEKARVDVVFGGHLHCTHVRTSADVLGAGARGVPLVVSGTATSRRGRPPEAGWNSVNVVTLGDGAIDVTAFLRPPDGDAFEASERWSFPLRGGSRIVARGPR